MDKSRWVGWRAWRTWLIGWAAFQIYMLMPWPIAKRCDWLLPYVGDYAHFDDALRAMDLK